MIRKAEIKDIPRIAEIFIFGKRVAYRDIFKDDMFSFNELSVVDLAEEYSKNPKLIENMLVFDDGIVKGVINREFLEMEVKICELYVEPVFTGCGFGGSLIEHVIEEARRCICSKITLGVIEENFKSRKFYEKHGFNSTERKSLIENTDKYVVEYELKTDNLFYKQNGSWVL